RRRHTRSTRDWSSDVCSSDLIQSGLPALGSLPTQHAARNVLHKQSAVRQTLKKNPPPPSTTGGWNNAFLLTTNFVPASLAPTDRSEERRVGKEYRREWRPACH